MSSSNARTRFENEVLDGPDKYMPPIGVQIAPTIPVDAVTMRDSLCDFFVNEKALPWQENHI